MATTLDVNALTDAVVSYCLRLGVFESVNKHEAIGNIGTYTASVMLQNLGPARGASGLAATSVRVELLLRIYVSTVSQPQDDVDPNIASATAAVIAAFSGGFSFSDTVREIDLLGEFGTPLSAQAGYIRVGETLYRIMDVAIPIIVDDVFAQVA